MRSMLCENHQLRLPGSSLWISANRYRPAGGAPHLEGVTLVFAHCSSGHKEQWEPVLAKLFELASCSDVLPAECRIREAWALDAPNHGDAAALNGDILKSRQPYSIQEYASMLASFIRSSSFVRGHDIVAIGHSASTSAWSEACSDSEPLPLRALVLVELPDDPRLRMESKNIKGVLRRMTIKI
ncbi:hypothetical protein C8T65DRAFT_734779 [Cerioporus squamosus]|nr:hypothetical protein C8T65DRAFT_734779 [Cerioporus squamosus]